MIKTKIAIIGCGIITREAHLPALKRLKDRIEVVALCNRTESKARVIADELELPQSTLWTDWKKMIKEQQDIEAVLIALPITMNHSVSKACCEAGIAVLCEKPAGMNMEEALDTGTFSKRYGITYMTAENYHFEPRFNKAAQLVKDGSIGKLHSTSWNLLTFMDTGNKYNKTQWRAHNQYPGGYVLDGGVHWIHALEMISGPVSSVYARTASIEKELGTMDMALCLLEHNNGVVSSLNMGWRSANEDCSLKLFGDKGTLIVHDEKIIQLTGSGEKIVHNVESESSFYLQWCDFLTAVETGRSPTMDPQLPIKDVKVIMSIIESGKSGNRVML